MPEPRDASRPPLPRPAGALLCALLPAAERGEVLEEVAAEYAERRARGGRRAAGWWLWRQVLASAPALARRGWGRGWSGWEPEANRMRPGGSMFESWGRDLRYALRRLRHRPTYAVLTILTLSLGVAGTAAVYSIVERLLLEPLPVRAEEDLAVFWMEGSWSEAELLELEPRLQGFQGIAAWRPRDVPMQAEGGPARLVTGAAATAEIFRVLGVSPALGPGFAPGASQVGAEPTVVLSHSLWRELGADPGVVGSGLVLGGVTRRVVGVMPAGFWFPDPKARIWLAEELNPEDGSGNWGIVGRMAPGATPEALRGELARVMEPMHEIFQYDEGEWDKRVEPHLIPLRERLVGEVRPALLATLGAMALLLLIACVNVAALMLGQVDSRGTELAVRTAVGAERRQLLQQLLAEALVIGAGAGVLGAVLATAGFRLVVGALPLGALAETAAVDWTVFAASIGFALAAATAVALAPGLAVARSDVQRRITRARTGGVEGRGGRLEGALVVAQVALVLLMAAGAGLLIRSVANLRAIDPGVEVEGLAVVDVVMPVTMEAERRAQVTRTLVEAVGALPGVRRAAATQRLPLRGSSDNWGMGIESRPELEGLNTAFRIVTPGYFEAMGIPLRSGRVLQETDRNPDATEGVVVINQQLADMYFPDRDPLGQRIAFMNGRWDRIVGVVGNAAEAGLSAEPVPARYLVYEQVPFLLHGQTLVLRLQDGAEAATVLESARRAVQATAPEVAVQEMTTLENVFDRAIGPARQVMALLALLGGLALALGAVGVYGVVSHFVTRRRRDWGIRIALGMRPATVVRRIVRQGGTLVATGIGLGLVAVLALGRLLASFLYGVGSADPVALAGAALILLGAGLLAAWIPARRASRIDPALVLREG